MKDAFSHHEDSKINSSRTPLTFSSFMTSQKAFCSLPIIVLVTVVALDNADKQLLASSFPMLEKTLNLDVKTLGYFSLFSNMSYALSLPLWGYLIHVFGLSKIHILLSSACVSWGMATIGIALFGSSVLGQALFRALNGVFLGSILPLSQTLLVEMVSFSMRGRAFGVMGLCEKLAGTMTAASVIYWEEHWQYTYWALGLFSIAMGWIAHRALDPTKILMNQYPYNNEDKMVSPFKQKEEHVLTLRQVVYRIIKLPAFACLVAQGVFGGTPWDMMSFLLLLMNWRGFTKEQIISIQLTSGLTGTIGGWLGGMLGDYAASLRASKGRIFVTLASVVVGIPLYGMFLYSEKYTSALLWFNLFQLVATWAPSAACRPLCADLTRNPSERAQIISMWIVLEKASGALFGAPLVGYLTSNMLNEEEGSEDAEKASILAFHLFSLSALFWCICAFFWLAMAFTIQKRLTISSKKRESGKRNVEMNPLVA
jgi:MFS family permease